MFCFTDLNALRQYLADALYRLRAESRLTTDPIEAAVYEGAIVELEFLWINFIGGSPPYVTMKLN